MRRELSDGERDLLHEQKQDGERRIGDRRGFERRQSDRPPELPCDLRVVMLLVVAPTTQGRVSSRRTEVTYCLTKHDCEHWHEYDSQGDWDNFVDGLEEAITMRTG